MMFQAMPAMRSAPRDRDDPGQDAAARERRAPAATAALPSAAAGATDRGPGADPRTIDEHITDSVDGEPAGDEVSQGPGRYQAVR